MELEVENLFSSDRFSGYDIFESGTRVNYGLNFCQTSTARGLDIDKDFDKDLDFDCDLDRDLDMDLDRDMDLDMDLDRDMDMDLDLDCGPKCFNIAA